MGCEPAIDSGEVFLQLLRAPGAHGGKTNPEYLKNQILKDKIAMRVGVIE